jgi:hypothetical protein
MTTVVRTSLKKYWLRFRTFFCFIFKITAYWLSRYVHNISLPFMSPPVSQQKPYKKQPDITKNQHLKLICIGNSNVMCFLYKNNTLLTKCNMDRFHTLKS